MATKYRSVRVSDVNYRIERLCSDYTGGKDWVHETYIGASSHDEAIRLFSLLRYEMKPKEFEL